MSPNRSRLRRPALITSIAVAIVLVVFVAVLATRSTQPGTVTESPLDGHLAPAVSGINVMDGKAVSLASERGHYVIVTFFASWCAPCSAETPQLIAYLFQERAIHASVLGVIYGDSAENIRNFLKKYGAPWPAVSDPNGSIAASYGVPDPPESFVVAPSGRVIEEIAGGVTEAQLLQVIGLAGSS
jgi:cytochrome c biogenesis protein CcmG/thiol:disulfide interchange protein DsbE